ESAHLACWSRTSMDARTSLDWAAYLSADPVPFGFSLRGGPYEGTDVDVCRGLRQRNLRSGFAAFHATIDHTENSDGNHLRADWPRPRATCGRSFGTRGSGVRSSPGQCFRSQ